MGKTYPPGVHQPMIFECANNAVHPRVGDERAAARRRPMDEILGLAERARRDDVPHAAAGGTRAVHRVRGGAKFKEWNRDELVAAFLANNHAAEAIIPMAEAFAHPQVIANDMVATVVDPDLGPTTQMGVPDPHARHARRDPGSATAAPASTTPRSSASSATQRPTSTGSPPRARSRRPAVFALEGVTLIDFGQYLAGPFGPMILGDLGADVIKVEPVTGDGMRMATKPFFGCQRGKRDIALNIKTPEGPRDRAEADRAAPTSCTTT